MRGPVLLGLLILVPWCAAPTGCADSAAPEGFSVALVLAGPENDAGWNQSAYEGLGEIRRTLGATTRKVTARTAAEIQNALRAAAEQGFDLVIGHGFEFNAPAATIAPRYPKTAFVTSGGLEHGPNLATIVLRVEEAAYQLGILAAHLTESGIVSAISGEPYEPVERVVRGLWEGLRSVKPEARVLEDYLGSWEDAVLAKEKAIAHAEAGADVFFQNADAAGIGIFEACRSRGQFAFGCNRDQSAQAPEVVIASAVADIPATLLTLAREVQEGRFNGGERSFGRAEGKTFVAINPALRDRLPKGALAAMEAAAIFRQ